MDNYNFLSGRRKLFAKVEYTLINSKNLEVNKVRSFA